MQADGEPWMQSPADIRLSSRSQARVLKLAATWTLIANTE